MRHRITLLCIALVVACATRAHAEVVGIDVERREPFAGGRTFGSAGAYELVSGRVRFAVDPTAASNASIADILSAPRDDRGLVRFSSDFVILRPVATKTARPSVFLEVINRGTSEGRYFFFGGTRRGGFALPELKDQSVGDAFAFEHGFTLAFLGWETNPANGTMRLHAPEVDVSGPVRGSVITSNDDVKKRTFPFETPNGTCPTDVTQPQRRLTVRSKYDETGTALPSDAWHFTTMLDPDDGKLSCAFALRDAVVPKRLYEVTFTGGRTAVAGLSFAAFRDFASYLKHGDATSPLSAAVPPRVLGFGYSQSARYLRAFLYGGFNADEKGRIAFDGMLISSAGAGRGSFDQRYAMPGTAGTSVGSDLRPTDMFPFSDGDETDPLTGERGSLLARARSSNTVPKIETTLSSTEFWARFASLTYVSPGGSNELPLDPNARLYFFAGTPHGIGPFPPTKGFRGAQFRNDVNFASAGPGLRALLLDLDAWVANGTEPPASIYPHLAHDLVPRSAVAFPAIPGVAFPAYAPRTWRMDFGPRFASLGIADNEPPILGAPYETLVPRVDADGNDAGGIALPFLAVPVGTFTGWNEEAEPVPSLNLLAGLFGSFVPFARTASERASSGDVRPSLAERYASRAAYLDATRAAARALVARRLMLEEDVEPEVEAAAKRYDGM
ncbi:MAG: hypothetical protein IAI49_05820 [Candidatus Eremiobacteraeota bacterium]|nr:hypothetical protein [Candidatus Eremiobacteraeota bacterium]